MKRRKNTVLSKINLKFKIHTIETTKYRLSSPKLNDCVCVHVALCGTDPVECVFHGGIK